MRLDFPADSFCLIKIVELLKVCAKAGLLDF